MLLLSVLPVHLILRDVGTEVLDLGGQVGNGAVDVLETLHQVLAVLLSGDTRHSRHAGDARDAGDGSWLRVSEVIGGHRVEEEGQDGDEEGDVLVHDKSDE